MAQLVGDTFEPAMSDILEEGGDILSTHPNAMIGDMPGSDYWPEAGHLILPDLPD